MRGFLPCVVLAAAIAACFGRAVGHEFLLWDDNINVTDNPLLQPPSWEHLARYWTGAWAGLYIPVSYTVFTLEAWLSPRIGVGGVHALDPRVFHLGTILLHFLAAWVVFRILRRLVAHDLAALTGALLFAVHPLQTESVAWVTETRGTLAGLLGFLAVERYLAAAASPTPARARRLHVVATLLFALALLSKPSAVAIPLILLVLDLFVLRRPWKRSLLNLSPWMALSLVLMLVTSMQQEESIRSVAPAWARPLIALEALAFYLEKLFVPIDLAADYGRSPAKLMGHAILFAHCLVPVALAAALACLPGRRRWLAALGVFVAGVIPVLGLVPFAYQRISTVADRYVYLSMLGPALALAWVVARFPSALPRALIAGALLACGLAARRQTSVWRDTTTLFEHALATNTSSWVAHQNLALSLQMRGQDGPAAAHYLRAIEIEPDHEVPYNNLGLFLLGEGRVEEAIARFRQALERRPEYARAHSNLGLALLQRGDVAGAEAELAQAVRLKPDDYYVHQNLGTFLLSRKRANEAVVELEAVLRLFALSVDGRHQLALALLHLGRGRLAVEELREALAIAPGRTDVELDLAWVLATHPNPNLRDGAEAVRLAGHAVMAADRTARALDILSAAYAESGRFEDALRTAREAAALASGGDLAAPIDRRIRSYERGEPWRGDR